MTSERTQRRHEKSIGADSDDPRSPAQRDRDRILYSSAFRRLSGITQVASPEELYPVHNRLTHSLKVAQVGRSLAMQLLSNKTNSALIDDLGGLDPDVVEAAALAHDLGHPPFGHVGERVLDELLVAHDRGGVVVDGYNGNAQSFRLVTNLSVRYQSASGLNLTRATLNAILKYPWKRAETGVQNEKWGVYEAETEDFEWCRANSALHEDERSLEAQLMDWADDITYAVHDMEDFFRAGVLPLERLATDSSERERFLNATRERLKMGQAEFEHTERAFNTTDIVEIGLPGPFRGSHIDRAALRGFTSNLIGKYVGRSITLSRDKSGRACLLIDPQIEAEVKILKALTWHYVIERPSLVSQRFGQVSLIRTLFELFCDVCLSSNPLRDKHSAILPLYYRERLDANDKGDVGVKRIVADLISGMNEAQVVAVHQRLTGQSLGSALDMYLQ
jgi:dGTPase